MTTASVTGTGASVVVSLELSDWLRRPPRGAAPMSVIAPPTSLLIELLRELLGELGLEMDEEMLLSEDIEDDPSKNDKTKLLYM